jgi:proline dehydrogenase
MTPKSKVSVAKVSVAEVLKQVQDLFESHDIHVTIDELNDLINSEDWDHSAKKFNQNVANMSTASVLTFGDLRQIDQLLAKVDTRVSPGGFYWNAYKFAPTKQGHGHGLFTYNA